PSKSKERKTFLIRVTYFRQLSLLTHMGNFCNFGCFFASKLCQSRISLLVILLDDIMQKVKDAGFAISKIKEEALTREMATQFYKDHEGKPFFNQLVTCMTEGPSVIMVLTKENAVEDWRQLMGPTDPEMAKATSPESIRAQFAQDILSNAVHGSSDREHCELKWGSWLCIPGEIAQGY
uniref:NME/NM23 family member 8 n=1 Tax=Bubo bubo TaxID=30461 RepID=A0A8C0IHF3_BUBBB